MSTQRIPRIAISVGDFNGIGPEIILKSLAQKDLDKSTPIVACPKQVLQEASELLSTPINFHLTTDSSDIKDGAINILEIETDQLESTPGVLTAQSGLVAMKSIEKCIELCISNSSDAMVTAPISKEAINLAGYKIPGHTEFLAEQTNTESVLMMLVSGNLRVALVTAHTPIRKVAQTITGELIQTKLELLADSLIRDFGISKPKIAVLGLNPHAGDGGVIGTEEIETISPLLKEIKANRSDVVIHGPYPADGFFGQQLHNEHDAILAMYHDQGLAPFKLLSFGKGVNFTAGLPIIRTSPDHGTAFDIAGKGVANPSSFNEAFTLAVELANKRIREN
ncbi:MAG: 4-hydroxythreonine-4-phosphate dehydrogenase PdxA [Balneola sp.]|jgi:4-hydroxythreonine-4-phosphate dehydrogenase|nr:4-hydroxythreonine-4-phosphate dehydrogenase PdxA [Balneola sp.]MBE79411.1 4-hydroxythreonine-4-phosphate dehydrogenase PdxA [Balneola sp.]|tara:strand:- start:177 stop:1187 length:1011 start_codon:yes stop_codon:yes gene_type:complete